ncbi:MAG: thiamine-monophosphate kinase, partial [Methylobacteriaceae bacterium]|nr:thiamine-monophosphate kinase [Methylobacteriaceae bacterium]
EEWLAAFAEGLGALADLHGCPLLGGDTVRAAGPLTLAITALGSVPEGRMVRRTGARAGDLVAVTGTIGNAHLGLALSASPAPDWAAAIGREDADRLVDRYRHPRPRLGFASALRDWAHAAMDVSDGLTGDLAKMLRAAGVGGSIDLDRVPLSGPARAALDADPTLFDRLVAGGDDYELLLTADHEGMERLQAAAREIGLPLTVIGVVGEPGSTLDLWRDGRRAGPPGSYGHF